MFQVPPNVSRINTHFVHTHQPLDVVIHAPIREAVIFFTLPPGDFVIIPFTVQPNCETKFLLRIFTDEVSNIWWVFAYLLCYDSSQWQIFSKFKFRIRLEYNIYQINLKILFEVNLNPESNPAKTFFPLKPNKGFSLTQTTQTGNTVAKNRPETRKERRLICF